MKSVYKKYERDAKLPWRKCIIVKEVWQCVTAHLYSLVVALMEAVLEALQDAVLMHMDIYCMVAASLILLSLYCRWSSEIGASNFSCDLVLSCFNHTTLSRVVLCNLQYLALYAEGK